MTIDEIMDHEWFNGQATDFLTYKSSGEQEEIKLPKKKCSQSAKT